jgi:hypothetical protein
MGEDRMILEENSGSYTPGGSGGDFLYPSLFKGDAMSGSRLDEEVCIVDTFSRKPGHLFS